MQLLLFVCGACWSSFITTMAWRYLLTTSHSNGPYTRFSACDHCHHHLAPHYLLPIFGFFCQRGHCHYCQKPIPVVWTICELICGLTWSGWPWWTNVDLMILIISSSALLILSVQDWFEQSINVCFFIFLIPLHWLSICPPVKWDAIVISLVLASTYLLHSIGGGDVDFMIVITILCGSKISTLAIAISCCLALSYIVISRQRKIPFIPFLCVGLVSSLIIQKYVVLFNTTYLL